MILFYASLFPLVPPMLTIFLQIMVAFVTILGTHVTLFLCVGGTDACVSNLTPAPHEENQATERNMQAFGSSKQLIKLR